MATWIRNAIATGNVASDTRYPEVSKASWLYDETGTLGKVLQYNRSQIRKVKSPEYKRLEQRKQADWAKINNGGGYSDSATTFVLDTPGVSHLVPDDVIYVPRTGEMMQIQSVDYTALSITVKARAMAGTAAALNDDDWILRLATMRPEGSSSSASNMRDADSFTNYAAIIETPVEWTGTELEEASYLGTNGQGSREAHDKKQALQKHTWDIDNALFKGKKSISTASNGKKMRTTHGVIPSISTTVYNHGGASTITEALLNTSFLENVGVANQGKEIDLFCSPRGCSIMDSFGRAAGGYAVNPGMSQALGVAVKTYYSSHGTVNIIPYIGLNGYYYGRAMVAMNRRHHGLAVFRDTAYKKDVVDDFDGRKDLWRSEIGFDTCLEETLGLCDGIDTGTAAVLPGTSY